MAAYDDDVNGKYNASDADTWGQGAGIHPLFVDTALVNSAVVTVTDIAGECQTFTLAAGGTLAGDYGLRVYGNISMTGGTNNHTDVISQEASGDVAISIGQMAAHLHIGKTGVMSNLDGQTYMKELTIGPGSGGSAVTGAAKDLNLTPAANNSLHQSITAGTVACRRILVNFGDDYTLGRLDASETLNGALLLGAANEKTLTMIGNLLCGAKPLNIYRTTDGQWSKLAMGGNRLTAGALTLGQAGAGKGGGKLDLGTGSHEVATIDKATDSDAGENELLFNRCSIVCSDTIDGTGLAPKGNGGHVHGGVLQDCAVTGSVHRFGATADTGNTNVIDCPSPIGPGVALIAA